MICRRCFVREESVVLTVQACERRGQSAVGEKAIHCRSSTFVSLPVGSILLLVDATRLTLSSDNGENRSIRSMCSDSITARRKTHSQQAQGAQHEQTEMSNGKEQKRREVR